MTSTNEDRTHNGTQRFSVQQAADLLGISTEATRQRIKRGTLPTERDEDGTVFVLLEADGMHTNTDSTRTNYDRTHDSTSLIESQQDQIEYLRQQLEEAHRANAEHRRLLAAALERIPELEAPGEQRSGPVTASEDGDKGDGFLEPQEQVHRSSWWRRFFGFD